MEDFLNSTIFKYCIFPLGSAIIGIAVKYATRNDKYAFFKKEDLAIGIDLILTACLMYVVLTTDRAVKLVAKNELLSEIISDTPLDTIKASNLQVEISSLTKQLSVSGWVIVLMFIALWSISTIIRKWGWKNKDEMKSLVGIAIPLAFGVLALILVMAGASQ